MSDEQPTQAEQVQEDVSAPDVLDALNAAVIPSEIRIRSASKREIDVRLAPFDTMIETLQGPEVFRRGAFEGTDPSKVLLMGLEHEVHLGAAQDGRIIPVRRPTGKAISVEEREDGGYATFRVARTAAGDEILALIEDGVVTGVSVEMGRNAKVLTEHVKGRRVNAVVRADLNGASPTYHPAYAEARVLAYRAAEEDAPVATEEKAPAAGATAVEEQPAPDTELQERFRASLEGSMAKMGTTLEDFTSKFVERLENLEERNRMSFEVPSGGTDKPKVSIGQWMEAAIKLLTGERIPDQQYRTVADFITTDNAGIVPDAYSDRLIGVIDPRRPFMASTERIPVPESGMNLVVPVLTQRPSVGEQMTQKSELASQKSIIGDESFPVHTYGGVGDLSIQLLKRADRSFLELYLRLLAEAYAIETEDAAVGSLITAINDGGPEPATALDPEDLNLGAAFTASFDAVRRPPDTIWLSTGALAAFIDAKSDGTNAPLYPGATAAITAAGGASGTISGLRPVHVPALDDKGAYAIVGPSSGFAWAEDGTFTLQVDVPSKAGRDVALVGMVWFVPWYPTAFTLFNVAS